jgi:SAM-dependent methyltransferase
MNKDRENPIKVNVYLHYESQWEGYSYEDVLSRVSSLSQVLDVIIAKLPEKESLKILDLGCGPAVLPLRLASTQTGNFKMNIYGIDLSEKAIEVGYNALEKNEFGFIHLLLADCDTLPFKDGSFDSVISNATFNLLTDKKSGFSEMARVINEKGIIVMGDCVAEEKDKSCSNTECVSSQWSQCIDGAPTLSDLDDLAQSKDFEIIEIEDLTETVCELVKNKLWDWPEFLDSDLKYKVLTYKRK